MSMQYVSGSFSAEYLNAPTLKALDAAKLTSESLFAVKNKWAVVTGARVGLGFVVSAVLVSNGANVIMSARDPTELQKAVDSLNARGPGKAFAVVSDLNPLEGVDNLVSAAMKLTAKVDILVNNAGVDYDKGTIDNFPDRAFQEIVHLNLTRCVKYAYVAAKSGLIQLTKNLAARLARRGILVNAIGPGVFLSQMTAEFVVPASSTATETQPLKR
ncbi:hypothetical protein HDU93_006676 [Gonapodya sp. JEL0774]|nr:hypothetical protein HDU93_006676 [Gonapodya sp. JEL0774]